MPKHSKRSRIIIDGSNFYFKLKDLDLHNLLNFNFISFGKYLSDTSKIVDAGYYVGKIKQDGSKKANEMFDSQQKLIGLLKNWGWQYHFGFMMKNDGVYHEKGVDVQIAVDILVPAYENICDKILLVSSDTDLVPAISKAQSKGMVIEYIGFAHKPSMAMINSCTSSKLLTKREISGFLQERPVY